MGKLLPESSLQENISAGIILYLNIYLAQHSSDVPSWQDFSPPIFFFPQSYLSHYFVGVEGLEVLSELKMWKKEGQAEGTAGV